MAKVRLADVEDLIREIFEEGDGKVSSVDSTYEKIDEETNKLVISMHHVSMGETIVMHTKFIFKTDKQKSWVIEDSFIYLYDIN